MPGLPIGVYTLQLKVQGVWQTRAQLLRPRQATQPQIWTVYNAKQLLFAISSEKPNATADAGLLLLQPLVAEPTEEMASFDTH